MGFNSAFKGLNMRPGGVQSYLDAQKKKKNQQVLLAIET
jgi:hypothetical protein